MSEITDVDQPAPIPRESIHVDEEVNVRPWVRFWARIVDYQLIILVFAFFLPQTSTAMNLFLPVFAVFIWTFIETVLLATVATTPGKWILRVVVRNEDGSKLSYRQALQRSFSVWWLGYGAGIFPVNIITMIVACVKLSNLKTTTWDAHGHFKVTHKKIGFLRCLFVVLFFIFLAALVSAATYDPNTNTL